MPIQTLIVMLLMLLMAPSAWATDYYVSPTGSDTANLCTLASPCLTITKGMTKLSPGDTLYIRAGTYLTSSGTNRFTTSNTPSGTSWATPIRISAFPVGGPATGIDYNRQYEQVTLKPGGTAYSFVQFRGDTPRYVIFEGMIFDGLKRVLWPISLDMDGSDVTPDLTACGTASENTAPGPLRFLNLEVCCGTASGIGHALFVHDIEYLNVNSHHHGQSGSHHGFYGTGQRTLFDGGQFHHNENLGIQHYRNFAGNEQGQAYLALGCPLSQGSIIRNVRVYANRAQGILLGQGTVETKAYNNVAYANGTGMEVGTGSTESVWNNTLWGNTNNDLHYEHNNAVIRNNIAGRVKVGTGLTGITLSNNLFGTTVDPQFVDPVNGDFRLKSTSPAINAGTTVSEVTTDILGVSRPQPTGGVYDIGAYEFASGVQPQPFDFTLSAIQPGPMQQVSSLTTDVNVTLASGTGAGVTFGSSGLPSGVSISFVPTSCTPPCTATATIQANQSAAAGTYPFTITGTNGATVRSTPTLSLALFCLLPGTCVPANDAQDVAEVMTRVAAYGRSQYRTNETPFWNFGVLHTGIMAHYRVTKDAASLAYTEAFGDFNAWTLFTGGDTPNRMTAGHAWTEVNAVSPEPVKIADTRAQVTAQLVGSTGAYNFVDAIFMGLPTFTRMGNIDANQSFRNRAFTFWQNIHTTLALFDATEKLYYRDTTYINATSPNGEKVLWSRGNGWAYAGLARILEDLPVTDPNRAAYLTTFLDMSTALVPIQRTDGFWNVNLADPNDHGGAEASGTALFVTGMAWGVRKGLLSSAIYRPVALKGWEAIAGTAVQADGRVGYVQPVGKDPVAVTLTSSTDFGVGVVLLAGSEIYQLLGGTLP